MTIDSVERMFLEELKDIYDVEKRLTKALPKMAKKAKSQELKAALQDHLQVTSTQVGRLEQIFEAIGAKAQSKPCMGIKGILEEGEETMSQGAIEPFGDLGIIASGRRVEHYEMAAYLTLQGLAQHLGQPEVEELIAANLEEETQADQALDELFHSLAGQITSEDEEEGEDTEEDEDAEAEPEAEEMAMPAKKNGSSSSKSAPAKSPAKKKAVRV